MILQKAFFVLLFTFVKSLSCKPECGHGDILSPGAGHIPPRPNASLTLTATPDPFDAEDPTTQAKLTLSRDLFSDENGEVFYYALLIAFEHCCEPPTYGTWNGHWPDLRNWEWTNTSYQVTPKWWNPFNSTSALQVAFTLGDGTCDSENYYCNKPLKKNTKYALKIRAFTLSGYQDTDVIYFKTLNKLPVKKIVSVLGTFLLVTTAAVCMSIFDLGWLKRERVCPGKTANDSFSPVPLSHKNFLRYAKELLNTPGRLGNEFHLLGTLSSDVSTLCLHAQRVDNKMKNRYANILPFDMTRVKLSVIDDDPSTDYINASFIRGYKREIQYIAGQGPKEETCHDFYRMVIEQNVEVIVMLTDLTENGIEKCWKYYPEEKKVEKFKDITVICKKVEEFDVCTKRVFDICFFDKNLVVTQFQFKNWRDFDCPENAEVLLKFSDIVSKHSAKGYVLVHSSAGAGRTGTYIAIDILLQEVKANSKISVFNTVLKLRQQRVNMVTTEAQLGYIYKCISSAIEGALVRPRETV